MNKKILTKFIVLFIALYTVFSAYSVVNAKTSMGSMVEDTKKFINIGKKQSSNIQIGNSVAEIASIGSILTTIGVAVMIGVTAYMGIKYLTAAPDAKAKLKTQLIGVVVAGVVIFGAYYIWKLAIDVFSTF